MVEDIGQEELKIILQDSISAYLSKYIAGIGLLDIKVKIMNKIYLHGQMSNQHNN